MNQIQRVSVIGLGAIGAAYASRLYDYDPSCIRVIADEARIQRYQNHDVVVNGRSYRFQYVSPEAETQPADLIIVAVKYDGLPQAIQQMRGHVGPETLILPLLNGISSEDIIAEVYGRDRVLHAMCVAIDAVRDGRTVTFSNIGRICFGDAQSSPLPEGAPLPNAVERVRDLFERAHIPYEIPADIRRSMWWKFMINVGINQTSAVLRAPYGVFQSVPEAHHVMVSAMQEVIELSQHVGVHLNDRDLAEFDEILHAMSPEGKTSMLQDVEAGRKTEVEYLAGTVCELGSKYGVATPVNRMLYDMIRTLEQTSG
ncbi:ketopantoate reductase family protein [Alicyclobacillus cycloheptanicus]|nr:ketopantoate reductase family protein [Alicyclobacillus cycloheptanicus]